MSHTVSSPVVVLKREEFLRAARDAGLHTRAAIAGHLGVNKGTMTRLLEGERRPGGEVIARTLLAFPRQPEEPGRFEDFFEIAA